MRFPPARLSTPTDASIDASETGALFQIAVQLIALLKQLLARSLCVGQRLSLRLDIGD